MGRCSKNQEIPAHAYVCIGHVAACSKVLHVTRMLALAQVKRLEESMLELQATVQARL